jgi:hypothetical protein
MLDISGIDTGDAHENVERKILDLTNKTEANFNISDVDKVHLLGKRRSDATLNRRIIITIYELKRSNEALRCKEITSE